MRPKNWKPLNVVRGGIRLSNTKMGNRKGGLGLLPEKWDGDIVLQQILFNRSTQEVFSYQFAAHDSLSLRPSVASFAYHSLLFCCLLLSHSDAVCYQFSSIQN